MPRFGKRAHDAHLLCDVLRNSWPRDALLGHAARRLLRHRVRIQRVLRELRPCTQPRTDLLRSGVYCGSKVRAEMHARMLIF